MKDNKISIGDRVKVLWNFDNKYYTGKVVDTAGGVITITAPSKKLHAPNRRISIADKSRIKKILECTPNNRKTSM
jgi:hypothetical protein